MKDNFSNQAAQYSIFRPTYPAELIDEIISHVPAKGNALDLATGNGQIAKALSPYFRKVHATDISSSQLENAALADNIEYSISTAENTGFPNQFFDVITVGQAVHWFDFDSFYGEAERILCPGGLLAIIGYSLFSCNAEVDAVIRYYYEDVLGKYWDKERRYLDEDYKTIPFPLKEIPGGKHSSTFSWDFGKLEGYLSTWSAVQHYKKANGADPFELIRHRLQNAWERSDQKIVFNWLVRLGKFK